jgi:hypothetical protein
MENKDLAYWKQNAEEDYMGTPISVLRYISELEKHIKLPSEKETRRKEFSEWFSKAWDASINSPDKHAESWID